MPKRPPTFTPHHVAARRAADEKARKAALDRARPSAAQRGYGADWRAFRAEVIRANPTCSECGSTDRLNVDHIVSVRAAPSRRLDPSNVRVLCHACHSARTARDQGFGQARRRGEHGRGRG